MAEYPFVVAIVKSRRIETLTAAAPTASISLVLDSWIV